MDKRSSFFKVLDTFWQEMIDSPGELPAIPFERFEQGSEEHRLLMQMETALAALQLGTRRRQNQRLRRQTERMVADWWALLEGPERLEGQPSLLVSLTPRERQVLALMADGLDNGEIGKSLFVSPATVKSHVSAILAKLDVESRTEAVAMALRLHWIE